MARWVEEADESVLFLSVLTLGEIRKSIAGLRAGVRRARLESWVQVELRPRFPARIPGIDEAVAERWGAVTAMTASAGKPVPAIDGLLAATALPYNLTPVTGNLPEVAGTGVPAVNPWQ